MRAERGRIAVAAIVAIAARPLAAQVPTPTSRWQPEIRLDGFSGDPWAVHLGAGLGVRVSNNVRVALAGGAGRSYGSERTADGSTQHASGRVELLGRFVLDPYREALRGPYAAAGIVQRLESGLRPRTRLTAMVGVEGRPRGGWAPSLEAGFGGGVRVGLVLRRALPDGR